MTQNDPTRCTEIQMAALARLDGEPTGLPAAAIDAHIAGCPTCQAALAGLSAVHSNLGRVDYERLETDLWPAVGPRLARRAPARAPRERGAILGLTAVLVAWRLAQLLLDMPAPVVNSVVPLVLTVLVLRRLFGDPFALRLSPHQLQERGA